LLTAVDGGCELRNTRLWILINTANTVFSVDVCKEKTMQAGGEGAAKQHAKKRRGQGAVAGREGEGERGGGGERRERTAGLEHKRTGGEHINKRRRSDGTWQGFLQQRECCLLVLNLVSSTLPSGLEHSGGASESRACQKRPISCRKRPRTCQKRPRCQVQRGSIREQNRLIIIKL